MLIGVDWGTSRLRAYLIDDAGNVQDRTASDDGLMAVEDRAFEPALQRAVAPLRAKAPDAPILMSGMVGSREGWVEAPYIEVPTSLETLGLMVTPVPSALGEVAIVPGLVVNPKGREAGSLSNPNKQDWRLFADVMRGEETEIAGVMAALKLSGGTFLLPGSHSKWVLVEDGELKHFRTLLTGELFDAVARHTILRKVLGEPSDALPKAEADKAFAEGVAAARFTSGADDFMNRLFAIRAEALYGRMGTGDAHERAAYGRNFLSGLMIGVEVKGAPADVEIVLVGASALVDRYAHALTLNENRYLRAPADCVALGHSIIQAQRKAGC